MFNSAEATAEKTMLDMLDIFDETPPNKSPSPQNARGHRKEIRYKVAWRVAVLVGGLNPYYGRVKDISLDGAAILNELNLKCGASVVLNIHIPALNGSCDSKIMSVHGKTIYTVYDADRMCFRVGVTFVRFEQESDRAYLAERLINNHIAVPDYVCRRSTDQTIVPR
ncbi:MAG: PilZ domain-containing protein [Gallionella sp.]|nr:PilZ domain-containing protein [Gallionella sp.]